MEAPVSCSFIFSSSHFQITPQLFLHPPPPPPPPCQNNPAGVEDHHPIQLQLQHPPFAQFVSKRWKS
ncbi:hypothetical protein QVD17_00973 [Tagetes erecta]|uniref:Uncharacterized protein n=1 Tax=Tagetes erecta TaxID=13708 RepID=A0AAD8P7Q2_TARER|nr:hypothetical protein QVD17_00973 [Tagetes erecta]